MRGVDVRREWRYIDLLISCEKPPFVVAIENKIDSGEHDRQLERYEETVVKGSEFAGVKSLLVFLTPEGDDPSDKHWVSYSYADLYQAFSRACKVNAGAIGGDVAVFIHHYLNLIGNQFMENEDLDKLCRQIYNNHHRALDPDLGACRLTRIRVAGSHRAMDQGAACASGSIYGPPRRKWSSFPQHGTRCCRRWARATSQIAGW